MFVIILGSQQIVIVSESQFTILFLIRFEIFSTEFEQSFFIGHRFQKINSTVVVVKITGHQKIDVKRYRVVVEIYRVRVVVPTEISIFENMCDGFEQISIFDVGRIGFNRR